MFLLYYMAYLPIFSTRSSSSKSFLGDELLALLKKIEKLWCMLPGSYALYTSSTNTNGIIEYL